MLALVVPITALLVGVALLLLGSGLLNTLLALRAGLEGYADDTIGLIMSGYFLGFFFGTFIALPLIRRVGHIRAFACCAALAACSVLLHVLFVNPLAWTLLRVMTGAALVILYTIIESWLNGQTSGPQRGRVFAAYMVINLGALAAAQQLLRLGTPADFLLFALAAILVSLSLVPITLTRIRQPEVASVPRLKITAMARKSPVAVFGAFLSGLAMGGFWGLGAIYGGRVGLDSNGVATFMSCAILGGALFQYPLGRYSDRHDRRRVIASVTVLAGLSALIVVGTSYLNNWIFLSIAIYGGFAFSVYPVSVALLMDNLEPENVLSGASGLLFLHGIGAAIGPAIAGQLMGWTGHQALPVYFVVMQMVLAGVAVWNLQRSKQAPSEQGAHFVPMVRTTPTALEMLPDEEENRSSPDERPEP